jgi:hypothetical protein
MNDNLRDNLEDAGIFVFLMILSLLIARVVFWVLNL